MMRFWLGLLQVYMGIEKHLSLSCLDALGKKMMVWYMPTEFAVIITNPTPKYTSINLLIINY
jgi:hypothetical protein